MNKNYFKIIGIVLLTFTIVDAASSKNKQENLALAKRSLLQRERAFFKTKPMSQDLRSFIEKYKSKGEDKREDTTLESDDTRKKRSQDVDENTLYVIQNGQLVPFKNIKTRKRSEEEKETLKRGEPDTYTVVPLVIPIRSKLIKTRTLDEDLQNSELKGDKAEPAVSSESTTVSPPKSAPSSPDEPYPESSDEEGNSNNTKEETQVLHRILQDVEGLMQWKHEGNPKEGVLCNLNGSWISDAAGMRFDVCYRNSTRKKFRIHVADRIPPNEDGFLCDGNWSVFGELPFLHSGMVIALAVHEKDKHIATFIGECRICEGSETVTGTWLIARSSRDCKDQKAAHKILSDVWRREQGHNLRKKHLQQIGFSVKDED